jgi:hypothetical protein
MNVHLQVVGGPYQGETFSVYVTQGTKASIGRAPASDVAFPATPTVSNNHAYITNQNGVLVLIDDNSTNGLWTDGQRVTRWPIRDGGVVGFGRTGPQIQFFVEELVAGGAAPPPGPMGGDTCPICGNVLDHNSFTCFQCRRPMCGHHYDPQAGICRPCTTRQGGAPPQGAMPQGAMPPMGAPGPAAAMGVPGGPAPAMGGYGGAPVDASANTQEIGNACTVCGAVDGEFFFSCPGCGRFQCARHHNPQTGYCADCSRGY